MVSYFLTIDCTNMIFDLDNLNKEGALVLWAMEPWWGRVEARWTLVCSAGAADVVVVVVVEVVVVVVVVG